MCIRDRPNVCIVSEEVEAKDMSLDDVVTYIAKVVADRAAEGKNFGTVDVYKRQRVFRHGIQFALH